MTDDAKPKKQRKRQGNADRQPTPTDPKFSPELCERFVAIIRRGNFREMACAHVGISSRTLRNWLSAAANGDARYQAFAVELEQAEAAAEDILVVAIRRAALKDWRAGAWLLEHRGAKRWGIRADVEQSVEDELARVVDVVEQELGSDAAARVYARLNNGTASPREAGAVRAEESGPGPGGNPIH